jgi:hypothetical protein
VSDVYREIWEHGRLEHALVAEQEAEAV